MIQFMIVLLMLLIGHPLASAQTPTRVMSGYAATSGPHAVLWIARDAGLFEKNGLRTDVAYIRSGSTMAQTLVSGEIQMSQMGGPAMLAAGVAGMDVTFVAVALNTTPIVIMGTVSKMEELKGKSIGVTRYGSNTDISARFAIRKAGLQPEKDIALIQLEDYAGIMGGIASGRIAAGALADPFTDAAKKLGYKEIADLAAMGLEFPFVGIVAKKSFIKDNMDTVQRFVRAYVEAIAIYKNNRDLAKDHVQVYGHQGSGNSCRDRGFLCAEAAAGSLCHGRRYSLRFGSSRGARPAREKLRAGVVYGFAFRQTARRQWVLSGPVSEIDLYLQICAMAATASFKIQSFVVIGCRTLERRRFFIS